MSILIDGLNKPSNCDECLIPRSKCDYIMNRTERCQIQELNLVRCADCRFIGFHDFYGYCTLGILAGVVKPWDYCSRGQYNKGDV